MGERWEKIKYKKGNVIIIINIYIMIVKLNFFFYY